MFFQERVLANSDKQDSDARHKVYSKLEKINESNVTWTIWIKTWGPVTRTATCFKPKKTGKQHPEERCTFQNKFLRADLWYIRERQ